MGEKVGVVGGGTEISGKSLYSVLSGAEGICGQGGLNGVDCMGVYQILWKA